MGTALSSGLPLTEDKCSAPPDGTALPITSLEDGDSDSLSNSQFLGSSVTTATHPVDGGDSAKQLIDAFDTFGFLYESCVDSVLSYGLGYDRDVADEITSIECPLERLQREEQYYRGVITNAMYTVSHLLVSVFQDVLPGLRQIAEMNPQDQAALTAAYTQLMKDLRGSSDNDKLTVTTICHEGLQPSSAAGGGGDTSTGLRNFSITEATQTPDPYIHQPRVESTGLFASISARRIDISKKAKMNVTQSISVVRTESKFKEVLENGDGFFFFSCHPVNECDEDEMLTLKNYVNLTGFNDEFAENGSPVIDVTDPEEQVKYISLLVKNIFLLPGVSHTDLSAKLLASLEYQKACQPGNVKFMESDDIYTFRQTKVIIKMIYSLVIQLKVREIRDRPSLEKFQTVEGEIPSLVIFMERTKRNIQKIDSTLKCKSVLAYFEVDGGLLVSHTTVILNTSLPTVIAKVVGSFKGQGAAESSETANMSRKYLIEKFGDKRKTGRG